MNIIDGKAIAKELRDKIAIKVAHLKEKQNITPGLEVVLVGKDPASLVYVRNKIKFARAAGMNSFLTELPHDVSERNLLAKINTLNNDPKLHGILIQLPLPPHINVNTVINNVNPLKDVDGFTVVNIGKLVTNQKDGFIPCTPLGCLRLIKTIKPTLSGLHAVIIGRSNIAGKPIAALLLNEDCTITITHSRTRDIKTEVKRGDIVIVAVGIANFVKRDWIKQGAIVIDVGVNYVENKMVGDVDFEEVKQVASAITPVPGGVGPMTIASLLENTLKATLIHRGLDFEKELQDLE